MTPPAFRIPPMSDHFDGARFFTPGVAMDKGFGDFLRWRFTSERSRWPDWIVDDPAPPLPALHTGEVSATYIGHATWLLRFAGIAVLTDPMFSNRASPFSWLGPKRVRAPSIALDALPKI